MEIEWYVHSCDLPLMILVTKACALLFFVVHTWYIWFAWQIDQVKACTLFSVVLSYT